MWNILLDKLPQEWNGHRIDSDFQTGIQISQCLNDGTLSDREKIAIAVSLLFPHEYDRPTWKEAVDGLEWFMNEYNHDNYTQEKSTLKTMDFDVDQWRIYAAFRKQYGIDLNKTRMHWFVFMGLLSNLDECSFTQVIDIRSKKLSAKMSKEERRAYKKAKEIYSIDYVTEKQPLSDAEKLQDEVALAKFHKMLKKESSEPV